MTHHTLSFAPAPSSLGLSAPLASAPLASAPPASSSGPAPRGADAFAPPAAPLAMPKQVLEPEGRVPGLVAILGRARAGAGR